MGFAGWLALILQNLGMGGGPVAVATPRTITLVGRDTAAMAIPGVNTTAITITGAL